MTHVPGGLVAPCDKGSIIAVCECLPTPPKQKNMMFDLNAGIDCSRLDWCKPVG